MMVRVSLASIYSKISEIIRLALSLYVFLVAIVVGIEMYYDWRSFVKYIFGIVTGIVALSFAFTINYFDQYIITFFIWIDSILNYIFIENIAIGFSCLVYLIISITINVTIYVLSTLNLIYVPVQFDWYMIDS
jgi:hypothetical protein